MIYCFLADGFEEIEALAPVDILRRAGQRVLTVGVTGKTVTSSKGVPVIADTTIDKIELTDDLQAVILPGGMPGTKNLDANDEVRRAALYCADHDKPVCAICAAPSVLGHLGLLGGKRFTCYPGFESAGKDGVYTGDKVVTDGRIITAKGAGCAVDFGLAITAALLSRSKADEIAASMMC